MSMVGSTIENVRWMTDEEMRKEGWELAYSRGVVLEMSGGGKIFASADEEGNRPGVFFGEDIEGNGIYIIPEKPFQQESFQQEPFDNARTKKPLSQS